MNPSQISAELRRIATAINNSQNPSRERVLGDLRRVLASMDETAGIEIDASMDHEAGMMGDLKRKFLPLALGICTMVGCTPTDKRSQEAIVSAMDYCLQPGERDLETGAITTQDIDTCSSMIESKLEEKGLSDGTQGAVLEFNNSTGELTAMKNGKRVKIRMIPLELNKY